MIVHDLADFLARSTDRPLEETTLCTILGSLPALSAQGPWLAGGALRRTLLGQEPDSDFDFFFANADQLEEFRTALEERGATLQRTTAHHMEFTITVPDTSLPVKIQCIRFAWYANAAEVIDSFDYTICQFAYDGQQITMGDFSLWDLGRKRLAVHKISFGVSSMRRLLKYQKQGYYACAGALNAILRSVADNPSLIQADTQYID